MAASASQSRYYRGDEETNVASTWNGTPVVQNMPPGTPVESVLMLATVKSEN
jgi:hypothetical protein